MFIVYSIVQYGGAGGMNNQGGVINAVLVTIGARLVWGREVNNQHYKENIEVKEGEGKN